MKSYGQKCSENAIFEMVRLKASDNLTHTFVFTFSRLSRHPKNRFCTVFDNPARTQFKNVKMCILGLKLASALIKV